jgi:uncharacterized membrane protein
MKRVHGIDIERVADAVRSAERATSGEIRVALARFYFWGDVRGAAQRAFRRLHMDRTQHANAVLIFVAPRQRALAIVGDRGIHERVGDAFWRTLATDTVESFKTGDPTLGLVRAIETIGHALSESFPGTSSNPNELPDEVVIDRNR